jgi:hypothetical protein
MRTRILIPLLATLTLFSTGCGKKLYVIKQAPKLPVKTYGTLEFLPVDNEYYLTQKMRAKDQKDEERYRTIVKDAAGMVHNQVNSWAQANWHGTTKLKARVKMELLEYYAGSAAGRFFMGNMGASLTYAPDPYDVPGPADGRVSYGVKIYDARNNALVASFKVTQAISGSLFAADKYFAFKHAGTRIIKFFEDSMKD